MFKNIWRLWAKALGEKASPDNQEADKIAMIRTFICVVSLSSCLLNLVTCFFIIAGVVRHWNN